MESALIYCKEDEKYTVKPDALGDYMQYCYMIQKYKSQDFRYSFIQYFQQLLEKQLGWKVYTCKITHRPTAHLASFIDVTVYLEDILYGYNITQQLEKDRDHPVFFYFYKALEQFPLPAVNEHLIRVFVESAHNVRMACFTQKRLAAVKESLPKMFPIVEDVGYLSQYLCLLLKKNSDLKRLYRDGKLEHMRKICYQELINRSDYQRELPYDKFHIKIDNSGIYQEKGSRIFFETEEYFNALIV